jgi:hypothetical protein
MAEKADNKFAKMIQTAREQQADADQDETPPPSEVEASAKPKAAPKAAAAPAKGRGRPAVGKRSDPDYETTTVFLRRDTKLAAARLLLGNKDEDLSDVLEKLLSSWVRKHL